MSSVLKPVGPEEPQVYWKRRGLVAGIALVALIVLWWLLWPKGGSDEPQPEAAPPAPTAPVLPSGTPSAVPSVSASPSATVAEGACVDTDIKVAVSADETTFPTGVDPKITMTITNEGTLTCNRDIGSGANEILVSSGGVQVWSSDDCNAGTESDIQPLRPGQPAAVTVDWPRTNGCEGEPVAAGSYDAVGRNDKVRSPKSSFVLQ